MGTFTAGGLKVAIEDGSIKIEQEGKFKKFLNRVEHVTFSGKYARKMGQKVLYITERCVFELTEKGMALTEIAPGVDLEKDILQQMDFKPVIDGNPRLMDSRIFQLSPIAAGRLFSILQYVANFRHIAVIRHKADSLCNVLSVLFIFIFTGFFE